MIGVTRLGKLGGGSSFSLGQTTVGVSEYENNQQGPARGWVVSECVSLCIVYRPLCGLRVNGGGVVGHYGPCPSLFTVFITYISPRTGT